MDRREYNRRYREAHKHPCVGCGKVVTIYKVYCHSCTMKRLWASGRLNSSQRLTGSRHPNWKGGIKHTKRGYVHIKQPDHVRADLGGYVLEHILVWEKVHNQVLPDGWIIHHLNGIKDDNRPQNLEGLPNKKHYLVLQAKAKRIQELEGLLNRQ